MAEIEAYRLTASQALALIKSNKLSVEAYARALLSRIESRDAAVQAWAFLDPELVLQSARELDALDPNERGPLHGVAIGVKDVILTKDMPTQHNSPIYQGDAPALDAASISILRNAGALIFGKTCTTEFAATNDGPKTCNPHDPTRTPGGSSSGSGAAVADMQVPIALGTQTGGSTIRPGSYNGIYAMKPTWNAISREGQKVYSLIFDTIGLYARSVDDIQLLANVFALEDDEPAAEFSTLQGTRFAFVRSNLWSHAGPGTRKAFDNAGQLLRQYGAECEEISLPVEFDELFATHRRLLATEGRVAFLPEYNRAKNQLAHNLIGHVENTQQISRKAQVKAFDDIAALRPKMDEIANRYTAIITPSAVDEAPVGIKDTGPSVFNCIWTALHTPVVNVPGFMGENGMPIGLSLVAARYRDQHLLSVSKAVGKVFEAEGGWKSTL